MVEKTELLPLSPIPKPVGDTLPAPPAPTEIGYVEEETGIVPAGLGKDVLYPPAPPPPPPPPAEPPPPATTR
tara:strand:- start:24 stop:239 length:216 start_codon:yes stop_codon:yes gene_type:complete